MKIHKPYLLFLGDAHDDLAAKTAIGVWQWRPEDCVGQLRLPGCVPKLPLDELDLEQAKARGAKTLLIGVANRGGTIADSWVSVFTRALELGFDLCNGLHTRLASIEAIRLAAQKSGGRLIEVREPAKHGIATAQARSGHRLLAVGTDCSVGKMYTTLAIERELTARGVPADFRATGQTGIMIAGGGVPVDAVVSDFVAGAIEELCPANTPDHWDVIEGQGSLFHPSFSGVSLGLLHGAAPDALVMCHEPTRTHVRGLPHWPIPDLHECFELHLRCARMMNPAVKFVGIAVNSSALTEAAARSYLAELEQQHGLPATDPVRFGVVNIVDRLLG
jgi:uncharacterized NAD-dependent epimerase/dehydratase family protein